MKHEPSPPMSDAAVEEAFSRFEKANPEPKSELVWRTPFELLVAVVLSAQATDKSVNRATKRLFAVANTPEAMLALGEEKLRRYISSIGLCNTKARHLIRLSEILVREHGGKVPRTRKALEALPGVGRKTANVLLNVLYGEPTIAVDTHIFRVANRTGLAPGKTPLAVERALLRRIPKRFLRHAHHWLVLHGRYLCTARRPKCRQCPIADLCNWPQKESSQ